MVMLRQEPETFRYVAPVRCFGWETSLCNQQALFLYYSVSWTSRKHNLEIFQLHTTSLQAYLRQGQSTDFQKLFSGILALFTIVSLHCYTDIRNITTINALCLHTIAQLSRQSTCFTHFCSLAMQPASGREWKLKTEFLE